jgi:hypothetical protein
MAARLPAVTGLIDPDMRFVSLIVTAGISQ